MFDLTKCQKDSNGHLLCQTRSGLKARILATDKRGNNWTIVALVEKNGEESVLFSDKNGSSTGDEHHNDYDLNYNDYDLINVPQRIKRTVWLNLYEDGYLGAAVESRDLADRNASHIASGKRIACVKVDIDCEEGHGL